MKKRERYMRIRTMRQLRDYLRQEVERGNTEPVFIYEGYKSDLDATKIVYVANALRTVLTCLDPQRSLYKVTVYKHPGYRMVQAYRRKDWSALAEEEKEALFRAIQIVESCRRRANSPVELELALHDWLCGHTTYFRGGTEVPDIRHPPRHLTAVGALLDGSANCQGYSDGFYVLASLAGFEVDKQSAICYTGGNHSLNTIRLDGTWYIVDVTTDDDRHTRENGSRIQNYRLFNASLEQIAADYYWPAEWEQNPVADSADYNYYYHLGAAGSGHSHRKAFTSVQKMAEYAVANWCGSDQKYMHFMLKDTIASWKELSDSLNAATNARGIRCRWWISCCTKGSDTFYYLEVKR